MKTTAHRQYLLRFGGLLSLLAIVGAWTPSAQAADYFSLNRLYNVRNHDHMLVTSSVELAEAMATGAYRSEGVMGKIAESDSTPGTAMLFRLYNPVTGDHYVTANTAEISAATSIAGYKSEGVIGYIYTTQIAGTTPLYRLYNIHTGDHLQTNSATERAAALSAAGYIDEGMSGFVLIP